jgi:hypothetical protein
VAGKSLDLDHILIKDNLACEIANRWSEWNTFRASKITEWEELQRYIFATDTTTTTNSKLPWKNKTTLPKLCQIRDNLFSNYMASMFPKRKWLVWEGGDKDSESRAKREAIQNYMNWVIDQDRFKSEIEKLVLDYIDYGNCFAMAEWEDQTQELDDKVQVGYVGPVLRRINPLDIVFNPVATSFEASPKIIRSLVSMGEVKSYFNQLTTDDNREQMEELWSYMRGIRRQLATYDTNDKVKDGQYQVDGFHNYRSYLQSNSVELLTFYGDLYDIESDTFYQNHVITVVDRHKLVALKPNPSFFGKPPIFHVGWRIRQDNLWAMGPLDNLVGMQYRIDHLENLKADVFDLVAFPPLKIKGYVEDFTWGPMEKIFVGDDGDVEMLAPAHEILNANSEIAQLEAKMEEMAGSPKEAMGFRTPGEKTKYEVQRLENAASRIFQNKISQFEAKFVERLLNAQLELARRKVSSTSIRVFDDELKFATFQELTAADITGTGIIRPMAARHFAEKAEMVQNMNAFYQSAVAQDPEIKAHFSTIQTAKLFEDLLEIQDYKIVVPFIRLSEQADAQRMMQANQQDVMMEAQTPSGLSEDDFDPDIVARNAQRETTPGAMDQAPEGLQI